MTSGVDFPAISTFDVDGAARYMASAEGFFIDTCKPTAKGIDNTQVNVTGDSHHYAFEARLGH